MNYITNLETNAASEPGPRRTGGRKIIRRERARDLEAMPVSNRWRPRDLEDMLQEEEKLGELNYKVPPIKEVSGQDLDSTEATIIYQRKEASSISAGCRAAVAERWGY